MTAKDEFNRQVRRTALLTVALLAALIFGIIVLAGGDWIPGTLIVAASLIGLARQIPVINKLCTAGAALTAARQADRLTPHRLTLRFRIRPRSAPPPTAAGPVRRGHHPPSAFAPFRSSDVRRRDARNQAKEEAGLRARATAADGQTTRIRARSTRPGGVLRIDCVDLSW